MSVRRFLVSWRTASRRIAPVGQLTYDGSYRFQYLPSAGHLDGFRPFPNFPDLDGHYVSPFLFPFFGARVMDRRRADFAAWRTALALPPEADDLDLLARSGGWRQGDHASVTEEPRVAPNGSTAYAFLVRGITHRLPEAVRREDLLTSVDAGDPLTVRPDEGNEVNAHALLVVTSMGAAIGWVPDALVNFVGAVVDNGGSLTVLRRNGPEQPPYLRLVAELTGRLSPGIAPLPGLEAQHAMPIA